MSSSSHESSAPDANQRGWKQALREHPRLWRDNRYVYPVLSRRARGISIGINLSPDQVCNFRCVYCQVDRSHQPVIRDVDPSILQVELDDMLAQVTSGALFEQPPFAAAPQQVRRVSDIAFSGDGEPTASPMFNQAAQIVVKACEYHNLPGDLKIVVITNATLLDRPGVQESLDFLHDSAGQIWAKLDAGTQEHYQRMNRCPIPLAKIIDNIALAAKRWRVLIQSMWLSMHGQAPDPAEVKAFADRLRAIQDAGGRIQGVQIYTVARQPAESYVASLTTEQLQEIAQTIRSLTALDVDVFPA